MVANLSNLGVSFDNLSGKMSYIDLLGRNGVYLRSD